MRNTSMWSRLEAAVAREDAAARVSSLSYWGDAWMRLRANKRAIVSFALLAGLTLFCFAGPLFWTVRPSAGFTGMRVAPLTQLWTDQEYVIVTPSWTPPAARDERPSFRVVLSGSATTHAVRLSWERPVGATGYHVYRHVDEPRSDGDLGVRLTTDVLAPESAGFEDRSVVEPGTLYYTAVAIGADGELRRATRAVDVEWGITAADAVAQGLPGPHDPGNRVRLPLHPLGTDNHGRDMLARLMHGGRVSLGIGIAAAFLTLVLGICYGSVAGYAGGRLDQLLMRFADFVVGLPFLLVVILLYSILGRSGGDGGVVPMLVAMVALSWPGPARLARGQVLQIPRGSVHRRRTVARRR